MAKSLATVIKILRAAHRGGAHDFRFAGNSETGKGIVAYATATGRRRSIEVNFTNASEINDLADEVHTLNA